MYMQKDGSFLYPPFSDETLNFWSRKKDYQWSKVKYQANEGNFNIRVAIDRSDKKHKGVFRDIRIFFVSEEGYVQARNHLLYFQKPSVYFLVFLFDNKWNVYFGR